MTTEVLRNMILAEPHAARRPAAVVVLDEVHFLQDPYRGGVWEEVLILAPPRRRCSSACRRRSRTPTSSARGSPQVRGRDRGRDRDQPPRRAAATSSWSADRSAERLHLLPTLLDGGPTRRRSRSTSDPRPTTAPRAPDRHPSERREREQARAGTRASLPATADRGRRARSPPKGLLPAIYFVFSRAGCDERCASASTTGSGSRRPRSAPRSAPSSRRTWTRSPTRTSQCSATARWSAGLEAGVAAHHAGMVPPFREAVEAVLRRGAREGRLRHRDPRARDQHAGTVGRDRRGDQVRRRGRTRAHVGRVHPAHRPGRAARASTRSATRSCVCSPFHSFADVARIAGGRPTALSSSFRPTYNLAVNLVRRHSREAAYDARQLFVRPVPERRRTSPASSTPCSSVLERPRLSRPVDGDRSRWAAWPGSTTRPICSSPSRSRQASSTGSILPSLAAVASAFCYEARREREAPSRRAERQGRPASRGDRGALRGTGRRGASRATCPVTRGVDAVSPRSSTNGRKGRELRQVLQPGAGAGRRGRAGRHRSCPGVTSSAT